MTRYVFIFVVTHLLFSVVMGLLLQMAGSSSGTAIGIAGVYAAAMVTASRFVKSKRRVYTDSEWISLRNGCLVYLMLFSAVPFLSASNVFSKLSGIAIFLVFAGVFLLNLLVLWMAQRFVVRKHMQRMVDRLPSGTA